MKSARLSITLRPKLYEWVKQKAEERQVSLSRCIEDCIEDQAEDGLAYPVEQVLEEAREAKREMKEGKLKFYETPEELFKALGI